MKIILLALSVKTVLSASPEMTWDFIMVLESDLNALRPSFWIRSCAASASRMVAQQNAARCCREMTSNSDYSSFPVCWSRVIMAKSVSLELQVPTSVFVHLFVMSFVLNVFSFAQCLSRCLFNSTILYTRTQLLHYF